MLAGASTGRGGGGVRVESSATARSPPRRLLQPDIADISSRNLPPRRSLPRLLQLAHQPHHLQLRLDGLSAQLQGTLLIAQLSL